MSDLRVLVVDDDSILASLHSRFVDRVDGFRVVGVAATAATAITEVERLTPDLVLLDVHLPDASGIDVLRHLRGVGNDVGVMVVTAAREADTVRAAVVGDAHYLVKPFEYDDLRSRLQAFARSHRGTEVLPRGLSQETADAVLAALRTSGELSAGECAERVGVSRVSARLYLEHFVGRGAVSARLQYGGAGRPERRYRVV